MMLIGRKGTLSSALKSAGRYLTAAFLGKADVRSGEECAPFGYDGNPVTNLEPVYIMTANNARPVFIGYINKGQLADIGEVRMYSTDANGSEQAKIWLHNGGKIEIGGTSGSVNANNAVQYQALNTAVQNDIVTFINDQLTLIASGIAAGGGTYSPGTMSVDLSAAKEINILLP